MSITHPFSGGDWHRPHNPAVSVRRFAWSALRLKICALDFGIALGRKMAGFWALLTLGWMYFRQLALGESLHHMFPGTSDPDLRQTMWLALLLILAMGWDIPNDQIAIYWGRFHDKLPGGVLDMPDVPLPWAVRLWAMIEPVVRRLGCVMDLCVAVANKVGALVVIGYMGYIAWRLGIDRSSLRSMYPEAADPTVSLLADLCVYVVVLAWWAMPMEQITLFWRKLRQEEDHQDASPCPLS